MSFPTPLEQDIEKQAATAASPFEDDGDLPPTIAAKRKIRYLDDDDNDIAPAGSPSSSPAFGYPLRRRASSFSVHSIGSVRAGSRAVDPMYALPITYRTVSFNISNSQAIIDTKDVKAKAGQGMLHLALVRTSG